MGVCRGRVVVLLAWFLVQADSLWIQADKPKSLQRKSQGVRKDFINVELCFAFSMEAVCSRAGGIRGRMEEIGVPGMWDSGAQSAGERRVELE